MFGYIFTNALAAIGVLCGWFNPFIGLMVYYALATLRPTWLWFWAFDPYNPPRYSLIVGISTLVGWVISGRTRLGGVSAVCTCAATSSSTVGASNGTWLVNA